MKPFLLPILFIVAFILAVTVFEPELPPRPADEADAQIY